MPVAQVICLSHASGHMHFLGVEGVKTTSKHKKGTKQVINASSCILLCCLSKIYGEVECFTSKLWEQPAPASQFQVLLFSACFKPHKNHRGLDKIHAVCVCFPFQLRDDSHLFSEVQGRQWRHGGQFFLVYSQHRNEVRGNKFIC